MNELGLNDEIKIIDVNSSEWIRMNNLESRHSLENEKMLGIDDIGVGDFCGTLWKRETQILERLKRRRKNENLTCGKILEEIIRFYEQEEKKDKEEKSKNENGERLRMCNVGNIIIVDTGIKNNKELKFRFKKIMKKFLGVASGYDNAKNKSNGKKNGKKEKSGYRTFVEEETLKKMGLREDEMKERDSVRERVNKPIMKNPKEISKRKKNKLRKFFE